MRRKHQKPPPNQVLGGDSFFKPKVQTKLAMGKPGDTYEVEADRMADQVVNKTGSGDAVQKMEGEEEVQQKPLAASITPLVQKMEEEEPVQAMKEEEPVQKMEEEEPVQKMEEEEPVQKMEEEEPVQKMEEEEPVQAMEDEEVQTKKGNAPSANSNIEGQLRKGSGGSKMDSKTQTEMESGFGADFSNVNIHNDSEAAQMSQDIGAQAFTHGNDVYFNDGKYNPESKDGKHLLAHELTHTIQQKGMIQKKVMKKDLKSHRFNGNKTIEKVLNGKLLIKKGSKGSHVRIVQQALLDAGFKLPKHGVDGVFGNETKKAVKDFQTASKLPKKEQDGIVGKITMSKLDSKYTGYKTEHDQFAGVSDTDVLKNARAITKGEKKDVEEAMSTEVKANPKTGKLPVFDPKNEAAYKKELKAKTEKIALKQYDALGKGKKAKRKDKKNLHSPSSINDLAKVSKTETDKVFGNIKKGNPLKFGKNIFDGWSKKENSLKGKSKVDQAAIQTAWAEWRIQKIVEGPRMTSINEKWDAVQSRTLEKKVVNEIIKELSTTYRKEMILTHLGWPGFASDGKIFLQRFKTKGNEGNRQYMWENFGTIIHEYIHTLEAKRSKTYSNSLGEKQGGKVLREGVADYFTKIVYENINFKDLALRKKIEGDFYNSKKTDEPSNSYYAEAKNAERIAGIIGINNLMASFFLGKIEYLKGT
ncbi:DUF4157 domain-containing protein [Dokdonia sp.]|uniref:eCIS core domain-containing protein n=1 Tax=Dokdonia sp. TaxID=2024995 RepID=UPI00326744C2